MSETVQPPAGHPFYCCCCNTNGAPARYDGDGDVVCQTCDHTLWLRRTAAPKPALEPELKPCPFCGSDNVHIVDMDILYAECQHCGATGPEGIEHRSGISGADGWNTRAAAKAQDPGLAPGLRKAADTADRMAADAHHSAAIQVRRATNKDDALGLGMYAENASRYAHECDVLRSFADDLRAAIEQIEVSDERKD